MRAPPDFLCELLIGRHINHHIHVWALPREAELWAEFRQVMHEEGAGGWLYGGTDATERPADPGYFIGYRIAQANYERAETVSGAETVPCRMPKRCQCRNGARDYSGGNGGVVWADRRQILMG